MAETWSDDESADDEKRLDFQKEVPDTNDMRRIRTISILSASIMWANAASVNAEGVRFTETITKAQARKGATMKSLVTELDEKGKEDKLMASLGPRIGLPEAAEIRVLALKSNPPAWVHRFCDLVYGQERPDITKHPQHLVLIDKSRHGLDVRFAYFRFDLTGRLLAAGETLGKYDENDKPIRGSAVERSFNITEPAVSKEANELLDFWRLGRYKRFLKKPAAPAEEKTAPGR